MIYLLLFVEFFKIGLFTVGGGLAALPFLYQLSDKYAWFTHEDVTNMIAVSEATPGPIGINAATYVGYTVGGVPGSIVATLANILPAVVIVLVVAKVLDKFKGNFYVNGAFLGIRPAVAALITFAFWSVFKISIIDWSAFYPGFHWGALIEPWALVLFAVALVTLFVFKKHPVWYILGGAIVGMIFAPG